MNPKVIQVIETSECGGKGVEGDPFRTVKKYYTLDGDFLAEYDDWKYGQESKPPEDSL